MRTLSIEINFLTGRFVATAHHDRASPEWPPHPARLFSALVATWADAHQPDPIERRAIEWLESLPAPSIRASDATPRTAATHFVPVNDARIVSRASYDKRACRVDDLVDQIEEAQAAGVSKSKRRSLHTQLRRQRDISGIVSSVGNTPIRAAVDIMPPGWISAADNVRTGQARVFPSVTPTEPRVTYVWKGDPTDDTIAAIDGLCARLTRLGHSSSLVSCRVVSDPPIPTHVPGEGADVLRSVRSGQLATLEREYRKHRGSRPRTLPFSSVGYRQVDPTTSEDPVVRPDTCGEWLVLAFLRGSKRFPSTRAVEVARALRGAVFRHATDPIPEGLSGHRREGQPSTDPHVAFLPLPWVGHEHSDGRLMGAAIAIPEHLDTESLRALLRAIGRWESSASPLILTLGGRGIVEMERIVGTSHLVTLRPGLWRRGSHRWVSATPIALPTHPGALGRGTAAARAKAWARAEKAVVDSCRHIGLPEPIDVGVALAPLIPGARPAPTFPAFRQRGPGGKPVARRLVHAAVTFDQPVAGPVVLGAGRYLGLGLMRPVAEPGVTDE
ncbi:type I-G CRISPR-associated protein Csb2 [Candidatus Spongiisocius sp.]|uniref:type I-G CRISPR-associated protein Csb2 n=1 Tax=Candidatus Spongiisocius sp. TaxID=3101273 RepID=UPI003B5BCAF5